MAINVGNNDLNDCQIGGTKVNEIYVGSTLVWPSARNPLITTNPTVYMPLDNDTLDKSGNNNNPIGSTGTMAYYTAGFDNRYCFDCIDGNKALILNPVVKGSDFTISVCAFSMGNSNTTRNGIMGGVIGGNHALGLGYAIGQRAGGSIDDNPETFQFYNGGGNQYCPGNASNWITNGWNHILVRFSGNNRLVEYYINGILHGLVTPDDYPHAGPISYSGRDRGWDGNIWLGRCFQTTSAPYDWWNGYLQDYAYWGRVISDSEMLEVFKWYKGNMIPSTTKGTPIARLVSKKNVFICTGGTGTSEGSIIPNGIEATTMSITKSDGLRLYINRSFSKDIACVDSNGYGINLSVRIGGTWVKMGNLLSSNTNYAFNLNGTGTYIFLALGSVFPTGNYKIEYFLPGMDSTKSITITITG